MKEKTLQLIFILNVFMFPMQSFALDPMVPIFHCVEGAKEEVHFNLYAREAMGVVEIQETDDGGNEAENDGQLLIRQLGAKTELGHQYLLTLLLSSITGPACLFPGQNVFLFSCNAFQTENNIAGIDLKDLTTGDRMKMNDFSGFSTTSIFRTEVRGDSGSTNNEYRFETRLFGSQNPWPNGPSETLVFHGPRPGVQSGCLSNF